MANPQQSYDAIISTLKQISLLGSVGSVLGWDERTQLPPKGFELRANQSSMLAKMCHEWFYVTGDRYNLPDRGSKRRRWLPIR